VESGPAGLTAAWQLALLGHRVKIFEAAPVAGGALRLSIPSYRLPAAVVERDNVAIDAARSARRLGAAAVHLACLEAKEQMPAYAWEVAEAEAEGVTVAGGDR
jgi:NADPH-dependent glutamate synthase beta subunit-like oxidoreductase